jgi:hypothetical protein
MLTVNILGNFARNVRPRATKRRAGYPGAGWEEEEKIPGTRFPEQKMRGNPLFCKKAGSPAPPPAENS